MYGYESIVLFRAEFIRAEQTGDFAKFEKNQPGLANYVIEHAYAVFCRYQHAWGDIMHFVSNYAESIDYYTLDKLDNQAKWALHGRTVRKFMLGS